MIIARQSTARTVMVGPVLDAAGVAVTDGVVADFEGSVNGGDPAALNGSATLTHRGVGFYSLALTATDLATVGSFEVTINDTVNVCPMKVITVVEEVVYDALFAASANAFTGAAGSTKVTGLVLADTTTTLTNLPSIPANWLTAAGTAADFGAEIQALITGGAYAFSTDANGRVRIVDGTGAGELDTLSGTVLLRAATQASIDAIEADTNELQTDWVNGGRLDLILNSRASSTEVTAIQILIDAIAALVVIVSNKIGNPVNLGSGNTLAQNLVDMAFQEAGTGSGTGYDRTTESLEGIASRLGAVLSTLGTILSTQGVPQTGDNYPILNDGTIGNANLKTLIDVANAALSIVNAKIGNPINLGSGNTLAYNLLDMVFQEAGSGTGTGYDRTTESLEAIATRIGSILSTLGTVQNSIGVPQTGDNYPIVSNATYGNEAVKVLIDSVALLVSYINSKVGNPVDLGSGNDLAHNIVDMVYQESGSGTGTGYDRTTESLEALASRIGSILQTLGVVQSNQGVPQTGDNYPILTNVTYGNEAIKVLTDSVALLVSMINTKVGNPVNLGSGSNLAHNLVDMVYQESGSGTGTGYDRTTESLEAISARIGSILMSLGVGQTGDAYQVVTDPAYGNPALQVLIDALSILANAISNKIGIPINLGSGNTLAYNLLDMVFSEAGSGTGTGYDRTVDSMEAQSNRLSLVHQIVTADVSVDTTTTPWTLVYRIAGTPTVLFRKRLTDTAGSNLTAETTIVGGQIE